MTSSLTAFEPLPPHPQIPDEDCNGRGAVAATLSPLFSANAIVQIIYPYQRAGAGSGEMGSDREKRKAHRFVEKLKSVQSSGPRYTPHM